MILVFFIEITALIIMFYLTMADLELELDNYLAADCRRSSIFRSSKSFPHGMKFCLSPFAQPWDVIFACF